MFLSKLQFQFIYSSGFNFVLWSDDKGLRASAIHPMCYVLKLTQTFAEGLVLMSLACLKSLRIRKMDSLKKSIFG